MEKKISFSIAPGVGAALAHKDDNRAYWTFHGDLHSLGEIYLFLLRQGFNVVKSDVYPGFVKEQENEYIEALRLVYEHKVPGWLDCYNKEKFIKYEICTEEEYDRETKSVEEKFKDDRTRILDI
jgi:hypothetical protein